MTESQTTGERRQVEFLAPVHTMPVYYSDLDGSEHVIHLDRSFLADLDGPSLLAYLRQNHGIYEDVPDYHFDGGVRYLLSDEALSIPVGKIRMKHMSGVWIVPDVRMPKEADILLP